jgi:hypothetical protein
LRHVTGLWNALSDAVDYALLDDMSVVIDRTRAVPHRGILGGHGLENGRLGDTLNNAVHHTLLDDFVKVEARTRN